MKNINPYLTFNGNCREAMSFYKECLGGELNFQTVGESPMSEKMTAEMKATIMHSSLTNGKFVLMGSDMVMDGGLTKGNAISILLNCESEEDIHATYKKLSAGGKANHPVEPTFWGAHFGDLTDKFGNHWMLNYQK